MNNELLKAAMIGAVIALAITTPFQLLKNDRSDIVNIGVSQDETTLEVRKDSIELAVDNRHPILPKEDLTEPKPQATIETLDRPIHMTVFIDNQDSNTQRILPWLQPDDIPNEEALSQFAGAMEEYPGVQLATHEFLWITERFEQDDWETWGPTIDEAIINYLGPRRIYNQSSEEQRQHLQSEWSEEGYFEW